jgi:hypothetical protein
MVSSSFVLIVLRAYRIACLAPQQLAKKRYAGPGLSGREGQRECRCMDWSGLYADGRSASFFALSSHAQRGSSQETWCVLYPAALTLSNLLLAHTANIIHSNPSSRLEIQRLRRYIRSLEADVTELRREVHVLRDRDAGELGPERWENDTDSESPSNCIQSRRLFRTSTELMDGSSAIPMQTGHKLPSTYVGTKSLANVSMRSISTASVGMILGSPSSSPTAATMDPLATPRAHTTDYSTQAQMTFNSTSDVFSERQSDEFLTGPFN